MSSIKIKAASYCESDVVAVMVEKLLLELEPNSEDDIKEMNLKEITSKLINDSKNRCTGSV